MNTAAAKAIQFRPRHAKFKTNLVFTPKTILNVFLCYTVQQIHVNVFTNQVIYTYRSLV